MAKGMTKEEHYKLVKKRAQKDTKSKGFYDGAASEEEMNSKSKKKKKIKGAMSGK
jgi:hypothetical protein